jgi:GT2 family glycosyltransferase
MTIRACVIIPNYNGGAFIASTAQAFLSGLPESKVVVVDDCSTDDSIKILEQHQVELVLRKRNGGFAAAVNSGLKFAVSNNYDIALVANSDLAVDDTKCREIIEQFSYFNNEDVAVIGFVESNRGTTAVETPQGADISGFLFAIRLRILEKIGYFDETFFMYGEEQDYFRRVSDERLTIIQSGVAVDHRAEGSGTSRYRNSWLAIRNSLLLEAKRNSLKHFLKKGAVLFLLINHLYKPKNPNCPSIRRVQRAGVLIGNCMLIYAVLWNIFNGFRFIK